MYLVQLIYASRRTKEFKADDIGEVLHVSRENNTKADVTGILCMGRDIFLQCLEGGRENVNEIYTRILRDDRHTDVVLLNYRDIMTRDFTQWEMAYIPEASITRAIMLMHSSDPEFDPYAMSGESCRRLLLALKEEVTTV